MFVRSVLGFSTIFRFDNLHICDRELIRSIYAVIKMFTRIETDSSGVGGRTGLMVRASDSGSGDPGSILGRVGVLFP